MDNDDHKWGCMYYIISSESFGVVLRFGKYHRFDKAVNEDG